jgi:ribose 5-phosphate isomerase B
MIYLGSDHGGFELKQKLMAWLQDQGREFEDLGNTEFEQGDDYPDFAFKVVQALGEGDQGILLCRSGQGMAMAANRSPHTRAIVGLNVEEVKRGRNDEDANVLVLAGDFLEEDEAKKITETFLNTPFSKEERHQRRIQKLSKSDG